MHGHIQKILRQEIIQTEERIRTFIKNFGYQGCHDPVVLTFGSDIESRLSHPNNRLADSITMRGFIGKIKEELNNGRHKHIFLEIEKDRDRVEIKLRPGQPLHVVDRYTLAKRFLVRRARHRNLGLRFGQGHWHLSVQQITGNGKRQLFNETSATSSLLAKAVALEILEMQISMPALFVTPRKHEKSRGDGVPEAYKVGDDKNDSMRICSLSHYENGSIFFEMRIANLAPHLPILLMLVALEEVIMKATHVDMQTIIDSHTYKPYKRYGDIQLGLGSHLDCLKKTFEGADIDRVMTATAQMAVAKTLIKNYQDYLEKGRYKDWYAPDELDTQKRALDESARRLKANGLIS